jgi:hypothetical protein
LQVHEDGVVLLRRLQETEHSLLAVKGEVHFQAGIFQLSLKHEIIKFFIVIFC